MSQSVFVIGLGNMGAALAKTLMATGNQVSVWNRTAAKAKPLVQAGAKHARTVADGVAHADIIVICVSNYDDTYAALTDCGDLRAKTVLQLTSGVPSEATAMEEWMARHGAAYIDGAIMAYPREVGTEKCMLLAAGSHASWQRAESIVRQLGKHSIYLGDKVTAPASLDIALLLPTLSALIGMIQGAAIVERAGMPVADYLEMTTPAFKDRLAEDLRRQAMAIVNDQFGETEASLAGWAAAITHHVEDQAGQGIKLPFARAICDILNSAVAAGYGDEELAAVIKVMR